jgi:hypothetical protein
MYERNSVLLYINQDEYIIYHLISVHLEVECPHIMISYQWDSQPVMLKVKDRLKHAGYKVWMDVEHMSKDSVYL